MVLLVYRTLGLTKHLHDVSLGCSSIRQGLRQDKCGRQNRQTSSPELRRNTTMRSLGQKLATITKEQSAMTQHNGPVRTRAGRLNECLARWISNSALGGSFGHWASKTIALPQLRRLVGAEIPWTTLHKPLSDSTVVLLSTGGVQRGHLSDQYGALYKALGGWETLAPMPESHTTRAVASEQTRGEHMASGRQP